MVAYITALLLLALLTLIPMLSGFLQGLAIGTFIAIVLHVTVGDYIKEMFWQLSLKCWRRAFKLDMGWRSEAWLFLGNLITPVLPARPEECEDTPWLTTLTRYDREFQAMAEDVALENLFEAFEPVRAAKSAESPGEVGDMDKDWPPSEWETWLDVFDSFDPTELDTGEGE